MIHFWNLPAECEYKPLFELKSILEDADDQKIKSEYAGMKNGRELFTELREVLRIESESVPLSNGLECNSESDVFEMMSDLERFKKKLSEQLQNYGTEKQYEYSFDLRNVRFF